ncbi:hypothetical protein DL764_004904 [Monosporascus ibericus]|uniref:Ketoreductase (KR) domain-containing protein n=1 Tax=Monosporascus ibericus TaxID=155417 RepID=A0A4Q4TCW5_9PEZI|nr:hypothetical protein DL764_004904 [Monosporascus ibericus]
MAAPSFSNVEERVGLLSFLNRQLFEKPTLPQNVHLGGKAAIVTGSNAGIGLECARQLLDLGTSKLIIAVRDESRGHAARANLLSGRSAHPDDTVEVWKLDLQSYDSIAAFAERTRSLERLDIVVLNAGVMKQRFDLNPSTGHEETIQVNVLSTALLIILLLPVLKAKNSPDQPGRVAMVSSDGASWAKFEEKNSTPLLAALDKRETFGPVDRYSTSKLLNQLFVTELTKRVPSSVALITLPSPGLCYGTSLGQLPGGSIVDSIVSVLKRIVGRPPSIGARSVIDGVVQHGSEAHGEYLEDCKLQPKAPLVYAPEGDRLAKALWDEVMAELSFANVEDIIQGLGK